MLNSHFPYQRLSYISSDVKLLKVLMFKMRNHFFGLPISVIFKVINCPPITNTTDSNIGIVDFEGFSGAAGKAVHHPGLPDGLSESAWWL